MMKQLVLILLIIPILSHSQCPPTGGVFTSQAQIDALAFDYPDCTEVDSFLISGDDINDLSGLYQINSCISFSISNNLVLQNTVGLNPNIVIRYVEGTGTFFSINNNTSLLTIDGLDNLVNQSGFESNFIISDNPMLVSVAGVPNSFNTLDFFRISNNASLVNLNGLEDYGSGTSVIISNNDSLIDLTGLDDLSAEYITISENDNLQTLNGPVYSWYDDYLTIENNQNLTDISGIFVGDWLSISLIIRNNPNLAMCSSENLCNYFASHIEEGLMLPGIFENNAPGCNSVFEAEYGCGVNSNDDCGYTPNLLSLGNTITANNEFATTSSQTPSCNDVINRKDVWFAFNSGNNTTIDAFVQAGFYLQLWEGYCSDLTQVDNACGTQLVDIAVNSNTDYYLQVWNDDTTERGGSVWFDLMVQDGALSTSEHDFLEFKIFPNPTNDLLNLESNLSIDAVTIYNVLGQNIRYLKSNMSTIDMSQLQEGMYFVKIEINGKTLIHKVLKQ